MSADAVPLADHLAAIRAGDHALQAERDRRYAEIAVEREKALKIKEAADLAALQLAREIQSYKDERANQLREQINAERGRYATREDIAALREYFDALHRPVVEFMAAQAARTASAATAHEGNRITVTQVITGVMMLTALISVIAFILKK